MQAEAVSGASVESELRGLRGRIDQWRHSQGRTRAMPEELWQEASVAAGKWGVCAVSGALRLNYQGLKRRLLGNSPAHTKPTIPRTQFVELNGFRAPKEPPRGDEAVVEVVQADGTRVSLRVKSTSANLAALVSVLRGRS